VCNIVAVRDSFASVAIPDIPAVDILDSFATNYPHLVGDEKEGEHKEVLLHPRFSMSTGDFVEIYGGDKQNHVSCSLCWFAHDQFL
jgi:hypothetical protein